LRKQLEYILRFTDTLSTKPRSLPLNPSGTHGGFCRAHPSLFPYAAVAHPLSWYATAAVSENSKQVDCDARPELARDYSEIMRDRQRQFVPGVYHLTTFCR